MWIADWCLEVRGGADPGAKFRNRYDSVEQAYALAGRTSLATLFNAELRRVGVKLTRAPSYGDAAMIKIGDHDLRGAIITSGYVVLAAGGGLSRVGFANARRVCAWAIQPEICNA